MSITISALALALALSFIACSPSLTHTQPQPLSRSLNQSTSLPKTRSFFVPILSFPPSHNDCLRWIADLRACSWRSDAALRVPCGSAVRRRERDTAASDGVHGAAGIGLPCQCASGSCDAASCAEQPRPYHRDRHPHRGILRSSRLAGRSLPVEQVLSRSISRNTQRSTNPMESTL